MSKLSSTVNSIIFMVIWEIVSIGLYVAVELTGSMGLFVMSWVVLYPAATLFCSFMATRISSLRWFIPLPMLIITAIEYIAFGFDVVSPNIIVTTLICLLFGCGLGNVFAPKTRLDNKGFEKKRKAEKKYDYKSIIDD